MRIRKLGFRRIAVYGVGAIVLLAVLGVAALVALGPFDLASTVAGRATRALGRPVAVAAFKVRVGAVVAVEMRDLVVENAPGGGGGPFLKVAELEAEIAPWSFLCWALFDRAPLVRRLSVSGVALALEHGADGRPNWRFGDAKPTAPRDPRPGFPILLDARVHGGDIDIQTSGGQALKIRLDDVAIATAGADQAVTLAATGAYNAAPVRIAANLQSFDRLHDAATPFGAEAHIASGDTLLDFTGTLTKPLAADGAAGRFTLKAPSLDRLLAIGGVGGRAALPIALAAGVTREGDLWRLTGGSGTLDGQPFQLALQLKEGPRRAPDDFTLDAGFAKLDLAALHGEGTAGETALHLDAEPGTLLDGHVAAKQVVYGDWRADDLDLKVKLAPGAVAVEPLTARVAGGALQIDGSATNAETGAVVRLDGALSGADANQLAGHLGVGPLPLTGAIDLRIGLTATGATAGEAVRNARGGLALSMSGGSIARTVVERASMDLRRLFREAEGTGRIDCLLGLVDLRDGVGRLAPLRLRSSDGTILGAGTLDLRRDVLDVTFATESGTTSMFALDVPVRVAGPIEAPRALPALGPPDRGAIALDDLPPAVRDLARRSPCLAGGR